MQQRFQIRILSFMYGNNFQEASLLVIEERRFRMEGQMVD